MNSFKDILNSGNKYLPVESTNSNVLSSFLFSNDLTSIFLVVTWFVLLIYVIVLTNQKPLDEKDPKYESRANEFSYVTTLFSLISFVIYFRFFPLGWANNGTMKFINLIIAILTVTFLFIIINKSKSSNSAFEVYKKNLVPFTATIFTLAAYSVTGTVGNFFGTAPIPGLGVPPLPKITSTMFDGLFK